MKAGQLHHIEIYVSDLNQSCEFWGWFLVLLGYELFQEWSEGKSWRLGDIYIVFMQTSCKYLDQPYHRSRVGLNHLAFHAESRRHVDEITRQLKSRGVEILYPDRHPHAGGQESYAVFFEDPDRIKVELIAPDDSVARPS
jgi:catechol 2,3-dioxygenase-like lactoylglutathione lyase family enzyme